VFSFSPGVHDYIATGNQYLRSRFCGPVITFYEKMNDLLAANTPFVMVTVVDSNGSVPQDVGAKMLVTESGLYYGTVGGGKVEARAILEAADLLKEVRTVTELNGRSGRKQSTGITKFVNWSLSKDIGMTCGGSVKMFLEAFNIKSWNITVFGAGHCSNALTNLLVNLDCHVTCLDTREEWLRKLPTNAKLRTVHSHNLPGEVANIPVGAFVLLMTMGHSSDMPILIEILRQNAEKKFAYIGVIGSDAKAARLKRDVTEAGLPETETKRFKCPMGLPIGTNHPQEIAISIAAQLLAVRDNTLGEGVEK
jgi:xanthine dehydrogenase accessory factor